MSRNRRSYNRTAYDKKKDTGRAVTGQEYVYGNTVRKLKPGWEQEPVRKQAPKVRKNREKAKHMSAGYVMFLAAALIASGLILVNFIQLQSQLTALTKTVAFRESELNQIKMANDEEYNRIISGIDLEEIKRIAIGELGMDYAEEGQIVPYENRSSDYMRQVTGKGN